jgi:hypothetical protein
MDGGHSLIKLKLNKLWYRNACIRCIEYRWYCRRFTGVFYDRMYRVHQRIGWFLSVKKSKKYWISWYSYIYKEVHTLAFAEISESVVLKHNTEHKKKQLISPLEIFHPQDALHYAAHTQQADREHYSWPYITRRPGFLKSLPVSAASVLELCEVMVQNTPHS